MSGELPVGLRLATGRSARLRQLLAGPALLQVPGAFDCVSARLVDTAGFPALYVTGSGVSMSALGAPDVGMLSFAEILDRVKRIADCVAIPVIADADTGYGGPLNVMRTVREMERAGVSGIQIEDQAWPKKCGHEPGRRLVSTAEMVGRIRAAADARLDPDTVIVARTDARASEGLEAALDRAAAYAEAGADVLFVEAPESAAEMRRACAAAGRPMLANMVEGGRTPVVPAAELAAIGYRLAIYPNSLTRIMARMGQLLLQELGATGTTAGMADRMLDHTGLWSLFEHERWYAVEARYTVPPGNA
ncbi:carboxyvinyl-carboxyphosphonate phosphorylmutase [Siccirubricoccus deserti]|uniref:2-methylisocitrate lyase n=1 Tax=Siccirubricoccus deserti TaxID=2013562 RepID=A0A9X0R2U9_9PROT|nr:isocitrate lyase/phosphoenolpyruvate mutase family protein [Siccirubricoccus deserti]MBC4017403.1 isocitrate lyase/phosphoenolpyruvate mutase family protein [Siccirubricoccus deserti]GGC58904.1 carboxyvinyl-carboxyphosphonate phosphorylmutase [Siccirubricoccus deserti]